ncbi:hypothetical protein [Catenulispora rubra]|uniref:hypothetical protein n=1 Tax=Catenulispora rubra TaxID=280293 RepID=UPI0018920D95|nr:hypothetical protein [Catenulispora rubra]
MTRRRSRAIPLAALAVTVFGIAACSSAKSTPTAAAGGAGTGPVRISVQIAHHKVSPADAVHDVHLGDQVVLTVTSDADDEVHLHGYDKEIEIAAGKPGTIDFTANLPGIFEVETHKSNLQLLQIEVK